MPAEGGDDRASARSGHDVGDQPRGRRLVLADGDDRLSHGLVSDEGGFHLGHVDVRSPHLRQEVRPAEMLETAVRAKPSEIPRPVHADSAPRGVGTDSLGGQLGPAPEPAARYRLRTAISPTSPGPTSRPSASSSRTSMSGTG